MYTRRATFAGRFYPASAAACQRQIDELWPVELPKAAHGGIVPHAGWMFSGATAALTWAAIAEYDPDVIVLFGAVHRRQQHLATLAGHVSWETPLGNIDVDTELADRLAGELNLPTEPQAHATEHAIEVQLPLLKHACPHTSFIPIGVQPGDGAGQLGAQVAEIVAQERPEAAFVGSTDLTHYGPNFGFEPAGHGPAGLRWAKNENDRRLINLVASLSADAVIKESQRNHNACGGGAVAATIGAMQHIGATDFEELAHLHSAEISGGFEQATDSVGYLAGVFR
jgi:AmmeMemoRadiSam system protein B